MLQNLLPILLFILLLFIVIIIIIITHAIIIIIIIITHAIIIIIIIIIIITITITALYIIYGNTTGCSQSVAKRVTIKTRQVAKVWRVNYEPMITDRIWRHKPVVQNCNGSLEIRHPLGERSHHNITADFFQQKTEPTRLYNK